MLIYNISKQTSNPVAKIHNRTLLNKPPISCLNIPHTSLKKSEELVIIPEDPENEIYAILTNGAVVGYVTSKNKAEECIVKLAKSLTTQNYIMSGAEGGCIEITCPGYILTSKIYTIKYEKIFRLI